MEKNFFCQKSNKVTLASQQQNRLNYTVNTTDFYITRDSDLATPLSHHIVW